jgi:hypothetical protein
MILIEGFHQWGNHPRPSIRTARTAGRLGAIFVLGDGGEGCASQSQRQQGAIQCFHSVSMVCVLWKWTLGECSPWRSENIRRHFCNEMMCLAGKIVKQE